jgi:hypothetical protein
MKITVLSNVVSCSLMKTDVSETSANFYPTTRRDIPERSISIFTAVRTWSVTEYCMHHSCHHPLLDVILSEDFEHSVSNCGLVDSYTDVHVVHSYYVFLSKRIKSRLTLALMTLLWSIKTAHEAGNDVSLIRKFLLFLFFIFLFFFALTHTYLVFRYGCWDGNAASVTSSSVKPCAVVQVCSLYYFFYTYHRFGRTSQEEFQFHQTMVTWSVAGAKLMETECCYQRSVGTRINAMTRKTRSAKQLHILAGIRQTKSESCIRFSRFTQNQSRKFHVSIRLI